MIFINWEWVLQAAKIHFGEKFIFNLPLLGVILFFLVLDIFYLARTGKKQEWKNFRLDLLWFLSFKATEFSAIVITFLLLAPANPMKDFDSLSPFLFSLQFILALFFFDLIHYGLHRLRHRWKLLWPFHMIHHSPQHLSIMSGTRVHPLETIFGRLIVFVPSAILYRVFPPAGLAGIVHVYYSFFTHINTPLSFGVLDRIFVSPDVHKIHHWAIKDRYSCNFAQVFSCIDRIFGTLLLPSNMQEHVTKIHGIRRYRGFPGENYFPEENIFIIYLRQILFPILQYRKLIRRRHEKL